MHRKPRIPCMTCVADGSRDAPLSYMSWESIIQHTVQERRKTSIYAALLLTAIAIIIAAFAGHP